MGDLLGKDHRAPVPDGSSSARSGSCVSTHAITPSPPLAVAAVMTLPTADEEEAIFRHGRKSKIKSKINLYTSGYVNRPHKESEGTYGECFYVSQSSARPRTSAGAPPPASPFLASAGDTTSSSSSRDRESEEEKETDDSEEELEGINEKSCGSRDLPLGIRESHLRAKRTILGKFSPTPDPASELRLRHPWKQGAEQQSRTSQDKDRAARTRKEYSTGSDYLNTFMSIKQLQRPLWAAEDTGAAATCVTNNFPIPLDHARPPRPEENMTGIDNGTQVTPIHVGDLTIHNIDPTKEPLKQNAMMLTNISICKKRAEGMELSGTTPTRLELKHKEITEGKEQMPTHLELEPDQDAAHNHLEITQSQTKQDPASKTSLLRDEGAANIAPAAVTSTASSPVAGVTAGENHMQRVTAGENHEQKSVQDAHVLPEENHMQESIQDAHAPCEAAHSVGPHQSKLTSRKSMMSLTNGHRSRSPTPKKKRGGGRERQRSPLETRPSQELRRTQDLDGAQLLWGGPHSRSTAHSAVLAQLAIRISILAKQSTSRSGRISSMRTVTPQKKKQLQSPLFRLQHISSFRMA